MANADRILDLLRKQGQENGVCDDCIEVDVNVHPRQQVNQICRRLEAEGKVARRVGTCSIRNHEREKVLNFAAAAGAKPRGSLDFSKGAPNLKEQTDILSDWLSKAAETLNRVENVPRSIEPIATRVSRLRREGLISSSLADKMLHLNAFRNRVVKERNALDVIEWKLAQKYISDCQCECKGWIS